MRPSFDADYVLLYQCGLANVVRYHDLSRVLQNAYGPCESFARGLIEAGKRVAIMHCDVAGDAMIHAKLGAWRDGKGDLWSESKRPPVAA